MKIIAKCGFGLKGEYYLKGDEVPNLNYNQIVKLNELGYIEPLDFKQLIQIQRELNNAKKEEE